MKKLTKLEQEFFIAAKKPDIDALELCIQKGVDTSVQDHQGLTALDHANALSDPQDLVVKRGTVGTRNAGGTYTVLSSRQSQREKVIAVLENARKKPKHP